MEPSTARPNSHGVHAEDTNRCGDLDAHPSHLVDGFVVSILRGLGVAHIESADGRIYGVRRETPGIDFDSLEYGQRLQCAVTSTFNRVLSTRLMT